VVECSRVGSGGAHPDLPVLEAGLFDWGSALINQQGPLGSLGMTLALYCEPDVSLTHTHHGRSPSPALSSA
jgi:hypothetical protein